MANPSVAWEFAALKAACEAALRARSPEELFHQVVDAMVDGGAIGGAGVLLAGSDNRLRLVAGAGERLDRLHALESSADAGSTGGAALVPILRRGSRIGVLSFCPGRLEAFDDPAVDLFEHIAAMISSALDNFEREAERGRTAQANERLDRRFRLLNATNKAILKARTAVEMFQMVCDAATGAGQLVGASISLHDPNSPWFTRAACSGALVSIYEKSRISADPALPGGRSLSADVFRTGEACFFADVAADPRAAPWRAQLLDAGATGGAVLPLVRSGRVVGVCSFFFGKDSGPLDDEGVRLTTRICQNLSFGVELFERQEQKDSITRMFVALSATNEAIMRAQTREELFELVCEAAVNGGKFTATLIGLAQAGSDFLRIAASAGPTAATSKRARLAITADQPEGRGLSGKAFVTGRRCITNDYLADVSESVLRETVQREGTRSGAALPLFSRGQTVGVLLFMSSERGAFTPELAELLERLAENISFALENFDRGDDRRLAEEQRERLTRMFAALSATNEAIMRARTRGELFRLVCEAAVHGGRFASTIIALTEPGDDFLRVMAWAGPNGELQRSVKIATTEDRPEGRGLSGTAFRTMQPCISNDYLADARGAAFHERARREGNKSGASLPLLSHGRAVGVLVFLSSERDAFTPELVELLVRLASNVSFALDNFDRADEKAKADERIKYLATHDGLTDLPNRATFNQLLHSSIESARRLGRSFAVLFIDIDRFKVINDSLGHEAGDALLVETGNRLRRSLRGGDVVARLGGDEFVIILEHASEARQIEAAARKILSVVGQPLQLCGLECRATASIGIAMFPNDGDDEQTLTKNADMAMYRAKEEGKNGFRFFVRQSRTQSVERLVFEARLRQALDRDEFSLHYQPKIELASGRVTGLEALLRWTSPDLGVLPPMQFISLAEETGLIVPIGRWVLRTACAQNMAWRRQGLPPLSMAVNLSPRQFSDENSAAGYRRRARRERDAGRVVAARNHRKHGDAQRPPGDRAARNHPRPRRSPRHRRFRDRLFLDVADEEVPRRHDQDRPLVRPGPAA